MTRASSPAASFLERIEATISAGNALEVGEAIGLLKGQRSHSRLREVTVALCAELLALGGGCADQAAARTAAERALDSAIWPIGAYDQP